MFWPDWYPRKSRGFFVQNLERRQGSLIDIPFEDASYDGVMVNQARACNVCLCVALVVIMNANNPKSTTRSCPSSTAILCNDACRQFRGVLAGDPPSGRLNGRRLAVERRHLGTKIHGQGLKQSVFETAFFVSICF